MATTATPMATKRVPLHSANLLLLLAISSSAYAVQNNIKQWDKNSATFQKAYTLLQQHGASLDVELFEKHPAEYQAYLLGSYSVQAHDYLLAIEWLKRAYADVEKLNEFTQQSVLYQLGYSYAQLGQLAESETWYRRAIAKGSADACVNLGVMFETKKQFQQAEQLYLSCLPDNESALLYLNLGTLYYNGLVKQDHRLGGEYWQRSAKLEPFDSDIQYNLGVYYLNTERDLDKARYYFSQCSWKDAECASVLSHPLLIGRSAEQAHWQALRQGSAVEQRHRLEDRAKHLLPMPVYFDDETAEIMLQVQLNDNGWQSITATTQSLHLVKSSDLGRYLLRRKRRNLFKTQPTTSHFAHFLAIPRNEVSSERAKWPLAV